MCKQPPPVKNQEMVQAIYGYGYIQIQKALIEDSYRLLQA